MKELPLFAIEQGQFLSHNMKNLYKQPQTETIILTSIKSLMGAGDPSLGEPINDKTDKPTLDSPSRLYTL